MTFLHTIFLTALAAAAIPLLLHLLSRQRLPLIRFSTLEFLKRLQRKKARKVKLRQIILLIIRTLALAALVMVFARPALQRGDTSGSAAAVEMVVILDDALPTNAESRDGQIMRLAVSLVEKIAELMNPYDRLTLLSLSQPTRKITTTGGMKDIFLEKLSDIQPTQFKPDMETALLIADSILSGTDLFNRELYVVSPFYGGMKDSVGFLDQDDNIRCFIVPVGPDELDNISVSDVNITSTILQRGNPVEIETRIENHSRRAVKDLALSAYLNGERVSQAAVDIPANSSTGHTFTIIPDRSGNLDGFIKIEDPDPLVVDNRRYFQIDIPDSLNILAIAPDNTGRKIINAVLETNPARFIRLSWADPVGWETSSFNGFNAVLLSGVESVSPGASQRLAEFVESGGGLVIAQGPEPDLPSMSRGLWYKLEIEPATGVIRAGNIGWGKFDLNHPIFTDMFEKKTAPRSPNFNFIVKLNKGRKDDIIIPFSDGNPFLLDHSFGSGKVLLYAVPFDAVTSDFIFSGMFAPLVFRSMIYVCSGSNTSINATCGIQTEMTLSLSEASSAILEYPDGRQTDLPPNPIIGGVRYLIPPTGSAGIYQLLVNGKVEGSLAVNISSEYSELSRPDVHEIKTLSGTPYILEDNENIAEQVNSVRFGRELWQPLAAIFLILLISESLIGRAWRKSN